MGYQLQGLLDIQFFGKKQSKEVMKRVIFFGLLVYAFSQANSINFRQQKIISQGIDTLSILTLKDKIFKSSSYKILHLSFSDSNQEMIQVLQHETLFATLKLPIADDDVKNFSVNKIEQTKRGFQIGVDWGGGIFFMSEFFALLFLREIFIWKTY